VLKCETDSNNPCTEDEPKESTQSVVLVVLPAEHQYAMKNVSCCAHVREMNEAISNTLLLLLLLLSLSSSLLTNEFYATVCFEKLIFAQLVIKSHVIL